MHSCGRRQEYSRASAGVGAGWRGKEGVVIWGTSVIGSTIRKRNKKTSNCLALHLKELENEEQSKTKVSRRKEVKMTKAEINEI